MNTDIPSPQQNNRLYVSPSLSSYVIAEFLYSHFESANLLTRGVSKRNAPDEEIRTNQQFWNSILQERTRAFCWVSLTNFQVIDWYPRSPGLFHTEQAKRHRSEAEYYIGGEKDGVLFYQPEGKVNLIQGGIGSVRFKPIKIEGQDCWLCTATSDGYCHSGIPLAIPQRLMEKVWSNPQYCFDMVGQVRFLEPFIDRHFSHLVSIPQVYVLVDRVDRAKIHWGSVHITPMVFFTTQNSARYYPEGNVTYVTCPADNYASITKASEWIKWYVENYDGKIVTNFDQQRPTFENAPFSLQNVMTGSLSNEDSLAELLDNSFFIAEMLRKVEQVTVNIGELRMGDTYNMSGDFRGTIINIRSKLNNVSQTIGEVQSLDRRTKAELVQLVEQLSSELQKAPQEKAEEAEAVAESTQTLVEAATRDNPNKTMVKISADGLKAAAQNIAGVMPVVLAIATQIVKTIFQLVGIQMP